jgi:hypothetical protein
MVIEELFEMIWKRPLSTGWELKWDFTVGDGVFGGLEVGGTWLVFLVALVMEAWNAVVSIPSPDWN